MIEQFWMIMLIENFVEISVVYKDAMASVIPNTTEILYISTGKVFMQN